MKQPTDEWLDQINEEFRRKDIPHKQRPWIAWIEWSKYSGVSNTLSDEEIKSIFYWFERNTKAGSQYIGPMYVGSFFYDCCFWPVFIPVVLGRAKLDASDSLKTMPDSIKTVLIRNKHERVSYASLWAACIDYGFGIEGLVANKHISTFGQELFRSGNQLLDAVISLLHKDNPNPKAIESARMATEMFLKGFLASKAGLTEKEAKEKIGHNLEKALGKCLDIDNHSELQVIRSDLSCFPEISDRYKGTDKTPRELWQGYIVAQFVGTTVVRSLTGRDVRKTMRIS